jgi:dihydroxyacetone kinase-like predicted kinase
MLTVVRELAEEAEAAAGAGVALHQALDRVLDRGADAVRRTPELLETLRLAVSSTPAARAARDRAGRGGRPA